MDRVREFVGSFLLQHGLEELRLTDTEWKHIHYLIELCKPFGQASQVVAATKNATVQSVLPVYNNLLQHVEKAKAKLMRKAPNAAWKRRLLLGVEKAGDKLEKYFGGTYRPETFVYGFAILLDPNLKDRAWDSSSWVGNEDWRDYYWERLEDYYSRHYAHLPGKQSGSTQAVATTSSDDLLDYIHGCRDHASDPTGDDALDELRAYRALCELEPFLTS
jgi:hypothetical protein